MICQFAYTERFQKHYGTLHPTEKKQLAKKLMQLSENPMHPSLRSKRIQGTEKYFESSVNMVWIIWFYEGEELIVLVDFSTMIFKSGKRCVITIKDL